ncbi:MAG: cytochrome c [Marinilabiliales bacterium]|nr:cytochrome c [Marinilabiliales bacterium]
MKKSTVYFLVVVLGLVLNACSYDFIVKEEVKPVDPTVDVLFATQIAPIFTNGCVSCHKPGGQTPDLSAANAYNSLKNANLFDTASPSASLIYTFPNPDNAGKHSWKKYSAAEAQLVLTWIQQGAKNN